MVCRFPQEEIADARAIGVKDPDRVRLLQDRNDPATDAASAQSRVRRD